MRKLVKYAAAATLTGVLAIATAMPSQAENGRNTAAAIGFGAGAVVGATAAGAANNTYYQGPAYVERGYASSPAECRTVVRHHINRYGERVTVRERECD